MLDATSGCLTCTCIVHKFTQRIIIIYYFLSVKIISLFFLLLIKDRFDAYFTHLVMLCNVMSIIIFCEYF